MTIQNVAIIFDDRIRADTTGHHCLAALRSLVDVEHFLPSQLREIPRRKFDLYLSIDDGLDYPLPEDLKRTALWAIDTHLSPERIIKRSRWAGVVFAAQRNGAKMLGDRLGRAIPWLPLACDPDVHRRYDVSKLRDVTFVGNMNCPERVHLLQAVRASFPNILVAQRYGEEMARTYSASRIVFNRSIRDDVNMRVFEALACGSLLLTNALDENGQSALFEDGTHLATYRSVEQLMERIEYYLLHEDLREKVAAAGRAEVLARHTYAHRMRQLLETLDKGNAAVISIPFSAGCTSGAADHSIADFSCGRATRALAARPHWTSGASGSLGCVLATKNRPPDYLERTLQTYAYQSVQPVDRVLVDYGSVESNGYQYASICEKYCWRYVRVEPPWDAYSAAAASNIGIARMGSRVDVIFRSDVDILLGQGVLATAHRRAQDCFLVFRGIRCGPHNANYPPTVLSSEQLDLLLAQWPFLESMEGDGVAAFPRHWFAQIGGYDLNFEGWGFEDSDLRARAERSIGVVAQNSPLLVHQWHPRSVGRSTAMVNYAYFQRISTEKTLIRNGGLLVRRGWADRIAEDPPSAPAQADSRPMRPACA